MAQSHFGSSNPIPGGRSLVASGLIALCLVLGACSDDDKNGGGSGGSSGTGGRGGTGGGSGGSTTGGAGGSGGATTGGAGGGGAGGGSGGAKADAASGGAKGDAGDAKLGDAGEAGGAALPPSNSPLTVGWTPKKPTWKIHSPHNLPVTDRVTYDEATGVHTMFINSNDAPMSPGKTTDPRAEYRWDPYPKGQHNMFDADVWIEPRTDATCVMQVFMTTPSPTSMMLSAWKDGTLRYYGFAANGVGAPIVNPKSHGVWWNLKVHHDTVAGKIDVYVNDVKTATFNDKGGSNWYFKNGVYGSRGRSETRWRNIRWWTKP